MNDLQAILVFAQGLHPLWAVPAGIILFLLRSKGYLKVPTSLWPVKVAENATSGVGTSGVGVDPVGGVEVDENEPLRDRLRKRIVNRFDELVADGGDPDDAYKFLIDQVRVDLDGGDE